MRILPPRSRPSRRTSAGARIALLVLGLLVAAGPPARAASEFEETLLGLAARALEADDLATARSRYQRVADANPRSAAARAGLGTVALREGDLDAAARHFEAAVAIDPTERDAQLGLADLARRRGDASAARARLAAAVAQAPLDPVLHQRLFEVTGLAPENPAGDAAAVSRRAAAHPYDPRAQLAAARLATARGEVEVARRTLEAALFTADLAPAAAPEASRLLAALDAQEDRRFVPVHLFADETVRAQPGWQFELRIAWARAARGLAPVLGTTFVPVRIQPFSSARVGDDLVSIHAAMDGSIRRPPLDGILAGFTRRESPRTRSANRLGQASFLGRELVVRIDPDDLEGRTLAHEILHLYGAVHLSDEIPSLMNPTGEVWALDRFNARIAEITRKRRFGPGSVERNVLSRVDEPALASALLAAIQVNVRFRNLGIQEALEAAKTSRVVAGMQAREAVAQDQHLADVARLTAVVLLRTDRAAEAVLMMENASRLYGPATPQGRAAQVEANRWRAAFKSYLKN